MILLSEDNEDMTVSHLLSVFQDVVYTRGSNQLRRLSLCNNFTNVIAFIDVVPDNMQTRGTYDKLLRKYMTDNAAFLYPVPCVEYYVLCMLDFLNLCPHYAYPFMYKVQDAYRRGTGFTDTYNIPGVAGSCSTFERLCKFLLDNTDIQYRNISVLSNKCKDGMGRFYVTDSSDIDLENKSRVLWYQFPLDLLGIHSAMDLDSMEARRHWEMYSSNYNNWLNNYQTVPFDSILTDSDKYQLEAAFTAANTEER